MPTCLLANLLTLIIIELKISVEQGTVITTLKIINTFPFWCMVILLVYIQFTPSEGLKAFKIFFFKKSDHWRGPLPWSNFMVHSINRPLNVEQKTTMMLRSYNFCKQLQHFGIPTFEVSAKPLINKFSKFEPTSHKMWNTQLVQDDQPILIVPIAHSHIVFGAYINMLSIVKVKILFLIECSYRFHQSCWLLYFT